MGAYRIVFHPGFYQNQNQKKALEIAKIVYQKLIKDVKKNPLKIILLHLKQLEKITIR